MFRVFIFSYKIFVKKNMHDEVRPWVNMISSLEYWPILEFDRDLMIKRPIWPTDEYAISAFRSVCRKQIVFVTIAPIIAIEMIVYDLCLNCWWISLFMRIIPYPPSLRRIAASTMDPATGAST